MKIPARLIAAWIAVLTLLIALAWFAATRTTRAWFEKDVTLRAQMAVSIARQALIEGLRNDDIPKLERVLTDISHDERVFAATLCTPDRLTVVSTSGYPSSLSCEVVGPHFLRGGAPSQPWRTQMELPDRAIQASAQPLNDGDRLAGFVVL
ncbi:MAG TPA: hypothetical protein VJM31_03485, partial [Vicinamibacterales bacterium]|nr:hypothetical protein [Vicinamibacterales bacterium]